MNTSHSGDLGPTNSSRKESQKSLHHDALTPLGAGHPSGGALRISEMSVVDEPISLRLLTPPQDHPDHTGWADTSDLPQLNTNVSPELIDSSLLALSQHARVIMGHHKYVSFDLNDDGRAMHLTSQADGGILIQVVSPGTLPAGTRYTIIEDRCFLAADESQMIEVEEPAEVLDKAKAVLAELTRFLIDRSKKPLIVQVSTQGYHENHPGKLELGIVDTGGQDKYINDSGISMTRLGFRVLNVNRAGPNHPTNHDSRRGMHYSHTGMDLLFVEDKNVDRFIPKEQMYPSEEWDKTPPKDAVFFDLARNLVAHLQREPQAKKFLMIGHYADGAMVALHARDIIRDVIASNPEMEKKGFLVPTVASNPHSLGPLKERGLREGGEAVPESLRLDVRKKFEKYVLDNADIRLSTSSTMTDSMLSDFGARNPDFLMTPGVDINQFRPRPAEVSRTDARYSKVWQMFHELNKSPIEVLQSATIVMEASRSATTKGKDVVIRAFAASLTEEEMRENKKFLAINIVDPKREKLTAEERKLGEDLHRMIDELGIRPWIITKNSFTPHEVALMHQVTDIFITGASSEPWGMSAQQAAASKQPIISTSNVPSVMDVLVGPEERRQVISNQTTNFNSVPESHPVTLGDGAIYFKPGDALAAANAIKWITENVQQAKEMAERAYHLTIPEFTWEGIVMRFLEEHVASKETQEKGNELQNYTFDLGKVVWKEAPNLEFIPEPSYH